MNIKNTFKPYIDAPYYINIYKADLNARIEGNFNKVAEHKENFDAFRNRASELVNRLTHNAVEEQGGIDYLQERPAAWIAKATAALVEYWYINDYKIGDININFSLGGMSLQRLKQNETFRKFVPETVVAAIQASGLAKNSVAFFDSTGSSSYQVCENELDLTELDARYQRKGNYDANFHTSIDIQGEQTQTVDTRYYKIAQVMKDNSNPIVFSMIADRGREFPSVKYFVSIAQTYGLVDASNSGVAVMTPVASTVNLLDVYVVEEADTLDVYVKGVDNDMSDILITDIASANYAEFGNYGSRTTAPEGSIVLARKEYTAGTIDEANILAQIAQLTTDVEALDGKITQADLPQIRIDLNKNTTDLAELKADYLSTKAQVQTNKNDIATLSPKVNANTEALKNKLDIQYTANDNGKLPQVIDGKLQLVVPSSLQASNVLGINLDDASLSTTNKRYASAVNELNRDKVAYRNQGSTFKVDGDDAVNYDLRKMEVNELALKKVQDAIDAIKDIQKVFAIPAQYQAPTVDTATSRVWNIPFSVFGYTGTTQAQAQTFANNLVNNIRTAEGFLTALTGTTVVNLDTDKLRITADASGAYLVSNIQVKQNGSLIAVQEKVYTDVANAKLVVDTKPQDTQQWATTANKLIEVELGGGIVSTGTDTSANKANTDLANVSDAAFKAKGVAAGLATKDELDTAIATEVSQRNAAIATSQAASATDATTKANQALVDAKAYADTKDTALHTTITTEQSSKIKYYKDQIIEFAAQKDSSSKFENTTLFDRFIISDGVALVGGSSKTITSGEVISHTHTQAAHHHRVSYWTNDTGGSHDVGGEAGHIGKKRNAAGGGLGPMTDGLIENSTPTINSTGGNFNKAYGLQILKCIYIAKKDITFAEMGE